MGRRTLSVESSATAAGCVAAILLLSSVAGGNLLEQFSSSTCCSPNENLFPLRESCPAEEQCDSNTGQYLDLPHLSAPRYAEAKLSSVTKKPRHNYSSDCCRQLCPRPRSPCSGRSPQAWATSRGRGNCPSLYRCGMT